MVTCGSKKIFQFMPYDKFLHTLFGKGRERKIMQNGEKKIKFETLPHRMNKITLKKLIKRQSFEIFFPFSLNFPLAFASTNFTFSVDCIYSEIFVRL